MAKAGNNDQQIRTWIREHRYTLLAPLIVMGLVLLLHLTENRSLQRIENLTIDWRMQSRAVNDPPAHEDLHIVGIEEVDLQEFGRWPWTRRVHATLLYYLAHSPPSALAMDILFTEPQTESEVDAAMGEMAGQLGVLVTAAKLDDNRDRTSAEGGSGINYDNPGLTTPIPRENVTGDITQLEGGAVPVLPIEPLAENSYFGFADSPTDLDGKRRHLPLVIRVGSTEADEEIYPSLVVQSLLLHWNLQPADVEVRLDEGWLIFHLKEGEPRRVPIDAKGQLTINWRNTAQFSGYSYGALLRALRNFEETGDWQLSQGKPEGKILMVGHVAEGVQRVDLGPTPLDKYSPLVITHANALNNILQADFLREMPFLPLFLVWLVVCCGSLLALRHAPLLVAVLVPVLILAAFLGFTLFEFFAANRLYPLVWPVVSFVALHVGVTTMRWQEESEAREQIRSVFSTYVAEGVMNQLLRHPGNLDLGGDSRPVAILFSDIRGFTPISESMSEQELVQKLNVYFEAMVECIHRHRGTLHKYIGDAIMAVWGDVVELTPEEAAEESTRAALEMVEALEKLNQRWVYEGELPWNMGVGINYGTVMLGNIGAPTRREFTVIGDAVNASSRFEGLTKEFGVKLAVGESVAKLLGPEFLLRPLGLIVVKGKTQAIKVFQVMADRANPRAGEDLEELAEWIENYTKAFELMTRDRQFAEAEALFARCAERRPEDFCTQNNLAACREYVINPPGADWTGETIMTTK